MSPQRSLLAPAAGISFIQTIFSLLKREKNAYMRVKATEREEKTQRDLPSTGSLLKRAAAGAGPGSAQKADIPSTPCI